MTDFGETLYMTYEEKNESKTNLARTNLALAAMITSHARSRLYVNISHPEMVGRLINLDTDSIMYEHDESKWNPPTGDMLGELEIEHSVLKRIAVVTKKQYAIEEPNGDTDIKCKGNTLNAENLQTHDLDAFKGMIDGYYDGGCNTLSASSLQFKKDKWGVTTVDAEKTTCFDPTTYTRQVVNRYDTVPYGWKE